MNTRIKRYWWLINLDHGNWKIHRELRFRNRYCLQLPTVKSNSSQLPLHTNWQSTSYNHNSTPHSPAAMEFFESNLQLHGSKSKSHQIKHEREREREQRRLAYDGIEESRFSNIGEANNTGSEAHADLGCRREASANHHNMVEMRSSGEERVSSEEGGFWREKKRWNDVRAHCSGHGCRHQLQHSDQSKRRIRWRWSK